MLAHVASRSASSANSRFFVYEVHGLRQSLATDTSGYPIRSSATTLLTVPYHRMSDEMQRLNKLGAKITNIYPLSSPNSLKIKENLN